MGALVLRLGTGRWRTCSRKRRKVRVLRSFQTSPQRSMARTFDSPSIPSRHEGLQWFIHLEMGRYTHTYIHIYILYVYYIYVYIIYYMCVCLCLFIYTVTCTHEGSPKRIDQAAKAGPKGAANGLPKPFWWWYNDIFILYICVCTYIYSTNPWYHGNDGYILCTFCWWCIYSTYPPLLGGPTWIDFDEG